MPAEFFPSPLFTMLIHCTAAQKDACKFIYKSWRSNYFDSNCDPLWRSFIHFCGRTCIIYSTVILHLRELSATERKGARNCEQTRVTYFVVTFFILCVVMQRVLAKRRYTFAKICHVTPEMMEESVAFVQMSQGGA